MSLPNFLGIGVSHGGTTWLRSLFDSHPDIHMPTNCGEIHFFDRQFERGSGWYKAFFAGSASATHRRAIGEISTSYYRCLKCPERIYKVLPDARLIIMIRHPVTRAYSHYDFYIRRRDYTGSFEDFLASQPRAIEYGFYNTCINRYLQYFDRSQLLIIVFEHAIGDVVETQGKLANFLNIDPSLFHAQRSLDAEYWLAHNQPLTSLCSKLKTQYSRIYQEDFDDLERHHQLDLSCWRENGLLEQTIQSPIKSKEIHREEF